MRTLARFVRAHWGTLLFIALLFAVTSYVVRTKRPPGSMTVIEAQAMDMSQTGTPVGSVPVATEKVRADWFVPTVTYTGSVVAYNDTDIVARVEGWVVEMLVYPGDRVRQGQLLLRLDSRERSARLQEAQAGASAARYEREAMLREAEQVRAELEEAQRKRDSVQAMVERARRELELARAEREEMQAEIQSAEANNAYWQAEDSRAENLLKAGAISREERQRTQAEAAKAHAELSQARARLNKAEARVKQAQAMLGAAEAQLTQAEREVQAMQAGYAGASGSCTTRGGYRHQLHPDNRPRIGCDYRATGQPGHAGDAGHGTVEAANDRPCAPAGKRRRERRTRHPCGQPRYGNRSC